MKKMMIVLLLAATVSTGAMAQTSNNERRGTNKQEMMRSPEDRAKFKTGRMAKKLNLTDAQQQAVYSANVAKAREMQPIADQMHIARDKRKGVESKYEASIKQTLTPVQYAQFEEMKAANKLRRMQHTSRGGNTQQSGYQPAREDMPAR